MKKNLLIFASAIILVSCQQSKQEKVNDFLDAINRFDKEKSNQILADNFTYFGKDTLNKSEYLTRMDSLKNVEYKSTILNIQDLDSIVKTEEKVTSIVDSLLEVTPNIIQKKTYRFSDDKLKSITVDTTLNYEEYMKSLNEKIIPFAFYVQDQHDIQDEKEIFKNIKKYLTEYVTLPVSDRKKYKTYASLQGSYVSKNSLYKKLIFRGKKTVTVVDAFFGFPFATSYELDENYIRIRTDKSDLLLEIKDSKTLIGEGWAAGTFTKSNE